MFARLVLLWYIYALCCNTSIMKVFGENSQTNTNINNQCINLDGIMANDGECLTKNDHHPSESDIILNNKPFIIYGTAWKKERTAELVEKAILSGFRFIDTACQPKHYNEPGVGIGWTNAATQLNLQRSNFFIQTKYTSIDGQDPNNIPYDSTASLEEQVQQSVSISLQNLKTNYIDSLVMHGLEDTIEDTMRVYHSMESFVDNGIVFRLGISNCYDYDVFKTIYEQARIKPSVLQNRLYEDSNYDNEIRTFCKQHNIWYQSFWTLTANRDALANRKVREWATEKSLTPQTLMFAFLLQLKYITPLSGTTNEKHMIEDITIMERIQNGEMIFQNEYELQEFAQLIGMEL